MSKIRGALAVPMTFNPESDEWELDLAPGALGWAYEEDGRPDWDDVEALQDGGALMRAYERTPTADDLAHMLGSALTSATPNVNLPKGYRPVSDGLVHMLDAALLDAAGDSLGSTARGAIIRQLVPILASVDQNAHLRGRAEALSEVKIHG